MFHIPAHLNITVPAAQAEIASPVMSLDGLLRLGARMAAEAAFFAAGHEAHTQRKAAKRYAKAPPRGNRPLLRA